MGLKGDSRMAVDRPSDRELVITRTFNAPVRIVYKAWTTPDLFRKWWALKSIGIPMIACDMDVRTGGGYRVAYGHDEASAMAFFGKYLEVVPNQRLVWTNEEDPDASVTTVTFEAVEGPDGETTRLTLRETYPSKDAMETSGGAEDGLPEQFAQLDELLMELG